MNATFAYFTSSVELDKSTSQTGVIKIAITDDTAWKVNSASISANTKLIPGDTLTVDGTVENAGNAQFYAILQLKINVTKSGETTAETIANKYYTYSGTTLKEITVKGDGSVTATAFIVDAPNANKTNTYTKAFSVPYTFDFYQFDNSYKNARVSYSVFAHAIQTKNLTDTTQVTKMLMEEGVLTDYQLVEYIESTGTQWINTGVLTETSEIKYQGNISYTKTSSNRQLMGGNNGYYFGIDASGYYEIGTGYETTCKYSTTGFDYFEFYSNPSTTKRTLTINNSDTVSRPTSNISNFSIYLFALNTDIAQFYCHCRIKDFKIYKDGILVRDFVPCYRITDNAIGLFDKVNKVFYTNSGSGSFLKGANV